MDPVQDEMLASFVVDSHFKSHPKHQDSDDDQQSRPVTTDEEVSDYKAYLILLVLPSCELELKCGA